MKLSHLAGGVALAVAAACLTTLPTSAARPVSAAGIDWTDCTSDGAQCATLKLPIDWRDPAGPTFDLAIARRTAKKERVGVLVFGPGGPGDSGVDRIRTGIDRFSPDLQDRFDIVSFDPRGIGASNQIQCSAGLLAKMPSPIVKSQAEYDALLTYNRSLAADCREHTGPLYDHVDSWQTVRDVDAIRRALGEQQISFHGSSYGTMLGGQYAETYPNRVRAMVLESVFDHSIPTTRQFLDLQAAGIQDSFNEFVKWCDRTADCSLHGQDVRTLWAKKLAAAADPFKLSFQAFRLLYGPDWPELANLIKNLAVSKQSAAVGSMPFAVFCQDWNLPVRSYREYAATLDRLARNNPDMPYPGQLMAVSICLGAPKADNPQHRLKVHDLRTPVLLANAVHDPATPYPMSQNVERQLGRHGVLLTYEGWGHDSYNKSACMQSAIDGYLIDRKVPKRGTTCQTATPVMSSTRSS